MKKIDNREDKFVHEYKLANNSLIDIIEENSFLLPSDQ